MTTYVCQGSVEYGALEYLRKLARTGGKDDWTILSGAVPGDLCVFYIVRPIGAFVATGVVDSSAEKNDDRSSPWYGKYMADVMDIKMLPAPVPLDRARRAFPEWGYLKSPRKSGQVPSTIERRFTKFLRAATPRVPTP